MLLPGLYHIRGRKRHKRSRRRRMTEKCSIFFRRIRVPDRAETGPDGRKGGTGMYERLTAFIPAVKKGFYGEWLGGHDDILPFVLYSWDIRTLAEKIFCFADDHREEGYGDFSRILYGNGIVWSSEGMKKADVSALDGKTVFALLLGAVRAERYRDGALMDFCESGCVLRWLERLRETDGG